MYLRYVIYVMYVHRYTYITYAMYIHHISHTLHISHNIYVSYVIICVCRGPKIRRESKRGGIIPRKCQQYLLCQLIVERPVSGLLVVSTTLKMFLIFCCIFPGLIIK